MNVEKKLTQCAVEIGQRLRARRKAEGLSLTDLSRLSGSTASTVSHIERGTRDVKLSTLVALADALRTDLPHLLAPLGHQQDISKDEGVGGYDLDDD